MLHSLLSRLGRCHLQLLCELPQGTIDKLDAKAILGFNPDREHLAHEWFVKCPRGDGKCQCSTALQGHWERRIPGFRPDLESPRLAFPISGQDQIFDKYGFVPGIYHLDPKGRDAVLRLVEVALEAESATPAAVAGDCVEHAECRAENRQRERDPFDGVHCDEYIPLHPVCMRTLRAASACDRTLANATRRTSGLTRTRRLQSRAGRLIRLAAVAFDRAADLAAQAR